MIEQLWRLIAVFSVLSVLGFGGGKGIIPEMQHQSVEVHSWISSLEFSEFYAIGRIVPGPTTIMTALIGLKAAGIWGAVIATAAMFVPAAACMLAMSVVWKKFERSKWKDIIAHGLAPLIVGLMWASVMSLGKGVVNSIPTICIALLVAALALRSSLSAPVLILASGAAGFALSFFT